jgi:hypothetical protein
MQSVETVNVASAMLNVVTIILPGFMRGSETITLDSSVSFWRGAMHHTKAIALACGFTVRRNHTN